MEVVSRPNLKVVQYKTGCLAHFAYVITSEDQAMVIDPLRDVTGYIEFVDKEIGLETKISHVLQTHYHADFVSGYVDLANKTQALIVYGPEAIKSDDNFHIAKDNELIELGSQYRIRVLHTPGHTFESSCYVLEDLEASPIAVFTGDTLFLGDVGRPDLAQNEDVTSEDLAGMLFESLKKLKNLDDGTLVLPGHGAGSACGKAISSGSVCTIGVQKTKNHIFKLEDKETFIQHATSGIEDPPSYFLHAVNQNKNPNLEGADKVLEGSNAPLTPEIVANMANEADTYIIDCRDTDSFDAGHIEGALFVPMRGDFAIWSSYFIRPSDKVIIVAKTIDDVQEAIVRLSRTGLDNVIGYLDGGMRAWTESGRETVQTANLEYTDAEDFAQKVADMDIIDVRGKSEIEAGTIDMENRQLLTLSKIRSFADNNDLTQYYEGKSVAIHCQGGARSKVAYSYLKKRGIPHVMNISGGYRNLVKQGVKVTKNISGPKCNLI